MTTIRINNQRNPRVLFAQVLALNARPLMELMPISHQRQYVYGLHGRGTLAAPLNEICNSIYHIPFAFASNAQCIAFIKQQAGIIATAPAIDEVRTMYDLIERFNVFHTEIHVLINHMVRRCIASNMYLPDWLVRIGLHKKRNVVALWLVQKLRIGRPADIGAAQDMFKQLIESAVAVDEATKSWFIAPVDKITQAEYFATELMPASNIVADGDTYFLHIAAGCFTGAQCVALMTHVLVVLRDVQIDLDANAVADQFLVYPAQRYEKSRTIAAFNGFAADDADQIDLTNHALAMQHAHTTRLNFLESVFIDMRVTPDANGDDILMRLAKHCYSTAFTAARLHRHGAIASLTSTPWNVILFQHVLNAFTGRGHDLSRTNNDGKTLWNLCAFNTARIYSFGTASYNHLMGAQHAQQYFVIDYTSAFIDLLANVRPASAVHTNAIIGFFTRCLPTRAAEDSSTASDDVKGKWRTASKRIAIILTTTVPHVARACHVSVQMREFVVDALISCLHPDSLVPDNTALLLLRCVGNDFGCRQEMIPKASYIRSSIAARITSWGGAMNEHQAAFFHYFRQTTL